MVVINNSKALPTTEDEGRTTLLEPFPSTGISYIDYEPLPVSDSPFLLLKGNGDEVEPGDCIFTFMSVPRGSVFRRRIPALCNKLFIGSHYGWIFVLDQLSEPSIFNPFTGQEIPLPSITTIPNIHISYTNGDSSHMRYVYRKWYTNEFLDYTDEEFHGGIQFQKIITSCAPSSSCNNFTVAAIFDCPESLAFVRAGEAKWNIVEDETYFDLMFCDDGSLIALEYWRALHIFRFNDEGFWVQKMSICTPEMVYFPHQYLVKDAEGGILLIRRQNNFTEHAKTGEVQVLRLVVNDKSGGKRWQHIKDLDGGAMFLGTNASLLLQAKEVKGAIQPDCIYFSDDWWDQIPDDNDREHQHRDICVYNLRKDTIEPYCPLEIPRYSAWPFPIWFHVSSTLAN
ncbi:Ubiquitin-protein ligase [Rhynchospora pubera]|uniref:Ubiquitin-protein ligase n=1 Tax=Rhynchospora pubera TaxID=906938 RepID=A0AAV8C4N1_9POAL|nr:Ubiquitin-protein ligase [Rhynchospora pubera]